ncbi:MAG: DUF4292 domain-containing protein [Dysgonamonadaceae bacterium]|jgi:hypothetical protein|nr:DUF4292 domain-containing protein [Dysgonamonadaceae bacterium]
MKTRINGLILSLLCAMLLLSGCKSTKTAAGSEPVALEKASKTERFINVRTDAIKFNTLSGSLKMSIKPSPTSKTTTLGAVLRIIRDRQIQLSLRLPIIGTEAARISFSPAQVLMIDRINHRYFLGNIEEMRRNAPFDFDYYSLQAMFCNQLFVAGKQTVTANDLAIFGIEENQYFATLSYRDSKGARYDFISDHTNRIVNTAIAKESNGVDWTYSEFGQTKDNQTFPMMMTVDLQIGGEKIASTLDFSEIELNSNFSLDMNIPANYTKISMEQIINMLKSISK